MPALEFRIVPVLSRNRLLYAFSQTHSCGPFSGFSRPGKGPSHPPHAFDLSSVVKGDPHEIDRIRGSSYIQFG